MKETVSEKVEILRALFPQMTSEQIRAFQKEFQADPDAPVGDIYFRAAASGEFSQEFADDFKSFIEQCGQNATFGDLQKWAKGRK